MSSLPDNNLFFVDRYCAILTPISGCIHLKRNLEMGLLNIFFILLKPLSPGPNPSPCPIKNDFSLIINL